MHARPTGPAPPGSRRLLDFPPVILHRGADAADRACGRSGYRPHARLRRSLGPSHRDGCHASATWISGGATSGEGRHPRAARRPPGAGYRQGQTILIEYRFADGQADRLPASLDELLRSKIDILLTAGAVATLAAQRATATVPMRMTVEDPVAAASRRASRDPAGTSPVWLSS